MPLPSARNSGVSRLCIGEVGDCFDFRQRDIRSVKSEEKKITSGAGTPTLQGVLVTISSF